MLHIKKKKADLEALMLSGISSNNQSVSFVASAAEEGVMFASPAHVESPSALLRGSNSKCKATTQGLLYSGPHLFTYRLHRQCTSRLWPPGQFPRCTTPRLCKTCRRKFHHLQQPRT